jgi:hypothetical protein
MTKIRRTNDPMKHISEFDRHYMAGLLDGEGTINLCRQILACGRIKYRPTVNVFNTCRAILEWCESTTGIGIIDGEIRKRQKHHKQSYIWRLRQPEMLEFLPMITPYLRIKEEQAIRLQEFLATDDFETCNMIYFQLRELNRTGVVHD